MFDHPSINNSQFNAVDLGVSLGVNYVATGMACKDSGMRIGVGIKDKSGQVPVYGDARLLGGIAAAVAAHFMSDNDQVLRAGHDIATGLLNSFVATESCRRAATAQAKVSGDYTAMLGFDEEDDDDLFDADVLGAEYEMEEADLNFAYGW